MKRKTALILGILLIAACFCPVTGYLTLHWAEQSLGLEVQGQYIPHGILPAYSIRNASLTWRDKFEVKGGTLTVRYRPFQWLTEGQMRFTISAEDLPVIIGASLSQTGRSEETTLSSFYADALLGTDGIKDIYTIEVRSPEIKISFGVNNIEEPGNTHET